MSRKILLIIAVIAIAGTLSGCQSRVSTKPDQTGADKPQITAKSQPGNNEYRIVKKIYTNKNVAVAYPQINGLANKSSQKQINELIKNEALAPYLKTIKELEPNQKYAAEGKYEIKLKNDHLLSIAYSSFNNIVPSAHPYNMFYTTNVDLKTGKKLTLNDFVPKVDKKFVTILKKSRYVGEIDKEYEQQLRSQAFGWFESDEKLIDALNHNDSPANSIFVYVTKDALGLSLPVAHVAGDHAEFEISRSDLSGIHIVKWN